MVDQIEGPEPEDFEEASSYRELIEQAQRSIGLDVVKPEAVQTLIEFVRKSPIFPVVIRQIGEAKISPRDANAYSTKLATRGAKRSLPAQEAAALTKLTTAQKRLEAAQKKIKEAEAEREDASAKLQECMIEMDAIRIFTLLREITIQAAAMANKAPEVDLFELLENIPDGGTPDFLKYELKSNNEVKAKFRELMQTREGRMQLREVILHGSDLFRNMSELYDMAVNKARGPM